MHHCDASFASPGFHGRGHNGPATAHTPEKSLDNQLRHPRHPACRFRPVESPLGRLQRLLRARGRNRLAAADHATDLGALPGPRRARALYHRSTIAKGFNCYLQDLFTSEASRGQGVGRALIEAVYAQARAAGSPRVYWHTYGHNATARRLYDHVADNPGVMVYQKLL